jgi:DNA-binding SARP family transcriptional activator
MPLDARGSDLVLDRYALSAPADPRADIDDLLDSVRRGTSRALTLQRDFGSGLSGLLAYAVDRAHGFQVLATRAQAAEQDLLYSGLLDLCEPLTDLVDALPDPQGPALRRALAVDGSGVASGDSLAVAVAARRLLARAAVRGPLLVVCDDAQWLDTATAAVLSFVMNRLPAAGVGVLFGVHEAPGSRVNERPSDLALFAHGPDRDWAERSVVVLLPTRAGRLDVTDCQADSDATPRVKIRLLGEFEVTVDGESRTPEFGVAAQAVKLIATFGGRLPLDRLVEYLWPDAQPDVGRARIRNVLSRARRQLGPLLLRDHHDIAFGPNVEVDATRFEQEAASALRMPPGKEAADAARRAVALYDELLPADRYAGWAAAPRERLRRTFVALLDRLAAQAEAGEQLTDCLDWLDRAIEVEPYDDSRYLAAARILVRIGRVGRAGEYLRRAGAITADLGLTPRADLLALQALLAETPVP